LVIAQVYASPGLLFEVFPIFACPVAKFLLTFSAIMATEIGSSAIEPGKDYASISPALAAEMPKPPFDPRVAGKVAFFFGPVAGALVSIVNLRRMGYPVRSKRILGWTVLAAVVMAVLLVIIPDAFGRIFGLAAEITFYKIYPRLQQREFGQWQSLHPELQLSSGWGALGWGLVGLAMFFVIAFLVMYPLMLLFPSLQ
jgi:hypothetical protein